MIPFFEAAALAGRDLSCYVFFVETSRHGFVTRARMVPGNVCRGLIAHRRRYFGGTFVPALSAS